MKNELLTLKNVGPATYEDLCKLGISSIKQLAQADPDELYARLQKITKKKQDPCVWDVFAAIIHEAKTGEKQLWWHWTKIRKSRQMLKNLGSDVAIGKDDTIKDNFSELLLKTREAVKKTRISKQDLKDAIKESRKKK